MRDTMSEERCETCRFWEPCVSGNGVGNDRTLAAEDAGNSGECRRHAPTRILADAPDALTAYAKNADGTYDEGGEWGQSRRLFPLTYAWDWCGEWQAKPSPG